MRIRVKICGLTRRDDAIAAADLGADALGFNFVPQSPRRVEPEQVARIIEELPPFVTRVGVFADAPIDEMVRIAGLAGIQVLQLHGHEDPDACAAIPLPWFKALRVDASFRPRDALSWGLAPVLLDGSTEGRLGGGGQPFDWSRAREVSQRVRVFVAGGLTPDNVAAAIRASLPWGVDVAGGVETSPGVKDRRRMALFIQRAVAARLEEQGT
jgi:phosphoribosylanthranilate isomerase